VGPGAPVSEAQFASKMKEILKQLMPCDL
jgi:hypothetical protein